MEKKFKFIVEDFVNEKKYLTRAYTLEEILDKREFQILSELHESGAPAETAIVITGKVESIGILDKNDKEIFEGDYDKNRNRYVKFNKLYCCFGLWLPTGYYDKHIIADTENTATDNSIIYSSSQFEITTNIYESPELLDV